jgi:hypothetical protein
VNYCQRKMGSCLERRDFEEQFSLAEDDAERITICQRWLEIYRVISKAERRFA